MPVLGPQKARQLAEDALSASFGESAKTAAIVWGGVFTVVAAFVGVAASQHWIDKSSFWLLVVFVIVLFPVTLGMLEFSRQVKCRNALDRLLQTEVIYEDLLRDARAERDAAKAEVDNVAAQSEVRMSLMQAHYVREIAALNEKKNE